MKLRSPVQNQYEKWPYPAIPLWAKLRPENLWQINVDWIANALGRKLDQNPSIWIAGCGTFQPYPFSLANPKATILATDFSKASLEKAQTRCRWHRRKNVKFDWVDLNDEATYPNEKFDFIECYGVLMSLKNPEKTLKAFHQRLKPGGILRLMVYTHYGRQRIFQIQKLAKLLGLGPYESHHPSLLKKLILSLSDFHPLKFTFLDYSDAKTQEGIVDGFLHASDRGFTGEEISAALDTAGFEYGFTFHRPWGNPEKMAKDLNLPGKDPAFWLHYLDLWQSLKSNFILCVVPKGQQSPRESSSLKKHPLFDLGGDLPLTQRWRLFKKKWRGVSLQSRTHANPINLKGQEVRSLLKGEAVSENTQEILGGFKHFSQSFFTTNRSFELPSDPWKVSLGKSPNPLYRHLFDAYESEEENLEKTLSLWESFERPLEDEEIPWGLTPGETYRKNSTQIKEWLSQRQNPQELFPLSEVRLKQENQKLQDLKAFLQKTKGVVVPTEKASLRMLWILLLSSDQLFLEFEAP